MSNDLILGWVLGLLSSLLTSLVMFWIEGKRDKRKEIQRRRIEDARVANNYGVDGKKPSLRAFDLSGAKLSGKDFSKADLEDSNLEGARLWGTNLTGANLRQVNFRKARLKGVEFINAILKSANFTGAELIEVDFTNADLRKAKLRQAKSIVDCNWSGAIIDESTDINENLLQEIRQKSAEESVKKIPRKKQKTG